MGLLVMIAMNVQKIILVLNATNVIHAQAMGIVMEEVLVKVPGNVFVMKDTQEMNVNLSAQISVT